MQPVEMVDPEDNQPLYRRQMVESEDGQQLYRRHYNKQKSTDTTIEEILRRFVDGNWAQFVGPENEVATKQQVKRLVKKLLRRNQRREVWGEVVFEKCFEEFGRWALTRELLVQFFKVVLPTLQNEYNGVQT